MPDTITTDTIELATLGDQGAPCKSCAAPLSADQRYCLNCGTRRAGPRVEFKERLLNPEKERSAAVGGRQGMRDWSPMVALGGAAALGFMLVVGVLIGKGGDGSSQAPVVQVGGGPAAAAPTTASNAAFASDWPKGKEGFTIELGTLPKSGSTAEQVAAQKADATSKGVKDVGALDSDEYASLPPGNYVVYSGVFKTKAEATKALKGIKSKFPKAKVVEVSSKAAGGGSLASGTGGDAPVQASTAQLEQLENLSTEDYQKAVKKLPETIVTPGAPAPDDGGTPGGGSSATEIK